MRKDNQHKKRDKKRARTIEACPHPEKAAFLSRQDALRAARVASKENPFFSGERTLAPYLCECGMWHLTSHPRPDTKHRKTRRKGTENMPQTRYRILKDSNPNRYNCIDLFAGAGGTALGLENAGFHHVLLAEIDKNPVNTLRKNRPDWNIAHEDITSLDFTPYRDKIDLVEGGFPCQALSRAGKKEGFDDPRGAMFFQFARAVNEIMPKMFVGENVKGLIFHEQGETFKTVIDTLQDIHDHEGRHYRVGYRVVKAQHHDVPQKRERLIIMGIRNDIGTELFFPKPRNYIPTLRDAIYGLPESVGAQYSEKKRAVLDLVPEGGCWRDLPEPVKTEYMGTLLYVRAGNSGVARRLSWDTPSLTLLCTPSQKITERCHPEQTRPLNLHEYARIQTFPDDWEFVGSMASIYKQIGNAVPPNLAYYIGKSVQASLGDRGPQILDYVEFANPEDYTN